MPFNRKALGVVAVAAFIASALFASVAHAEEEKTPTFTATSTPVQETGTQLESHTITVKTGQIKCSEATLKDESGNGGMMLLMKAAYSGCVITGINASVNMNGCLYTFEPIKTVEADRYTGRMGVECEGKEIEITVGKCIIKIPGQINLETVEFTNNTNALEPTKSDETWNTEIKNAKYKQTGTCSAGTGEFEGLTYKGRTTVKGESKETLEPIGLWIGD